MHYCSQEKETDALLLLGERKRCTTVLKEKGYSALLFSVEGNWCATVLKEKETITLLLMFLPGEEDWYSSVFGTRLMKLYCALENVNRAVASLHVNSDESRQLVLVKFGEICGFCFQQEIFG